MTKSQKEEWINNHGNRVWFSEGYDPNLGLASGTWWHKTGNKTLEELGKQEKRMTREEAIKIVKGCHSSDFYLVDVLEKLGVLKLEEPKSVRDQAINCLFGKWTGIDAVAQLELHGFKIVKV